MKHTKTQQAKAAARVAQHVPGIRTEDNPDSLTYAINACKQVVGKTDDISWARCVISNVAQLASIVGSATLVMQVTDMLVLSALAFTTAPWLAFVVFMIGIMIAYIAAVVASRLAGEYIRSKRIDKHAQRVVDVVCFWRDSDPVAATRKKYESALASRKQAVAA